MARLPINAARRGAPSRGAPICAGMALPSAVAAPWGTRPDTYSKLTPHRSRDRSARKQRRLPVAAVTGGELAGSWRGRGGLPQAGRRRSPAGLSGRGVSHGGGARSAAPSNGARNRLGLAGGDAHHDQDGESGDEPDPRFLQKAFALFLGRIAHISISIGLVEALMARLYRVDGGHGESPRTLANRAYRFLQYARACQ